MLTEGLLFRVRLVGMTSLRLNPNALNFPFISSKTDCFASASLLSLDFSAKSRTVRSSVRREATCRNVETPSGIQVPDEPVGLSAPDHSGV